MKRQKANVRSIVYQYGTVPARVAPVLGEPEALGQMKLARRLWNLLVSIQRAHTTRYRLIMHDEVQEQIDELRQRKQALTQERKAQRKQARSRPPTPELDAELRRVSASLHMLIDHQKTIQTERHGARRPQLDALALRTRRRIIKARQAAASFGLYWGTYNAILQSADAGRKLGELQHRGFCGTGTVTAQIQGGAEPGECLGGDHTFFQLDGPTPSQKWRYARVRISSSGRAPVWLALPIVYHREIPPEARIKSVSATRRIIVGKVCWSLNVTVTLPPIIPKTAGAAVAFDIGFRLLPEGVRVAYWQDDHGNHDEVLVSHADIGQFRKIDDLRSITDRNRDQFLPQLVEFLKPRELDGEWRDRTAYLAQWRSSDRLAAFVRWWSDHRLAGDEEMYQTAIAWRRQYLHLADWWRNLQDQMTLRLREQYRVFAAGVAARYQALILEDFDLREVAKKTESGKEKTAGASYRQLVAPSVFRDALVNACRQEGLEIRKVPAQYTTAMCHRCRTIEAWDQAASVMHRCSSCGALWDQDHNAAINLLASGQALDTKNQGDGTGIPPELEDRSQTEEKEGVESAR
jgi:hypothetical protein